MTGFQPEIHCEKEVKEIERNMFLVYTGLRKWIIILHGA